MEVKTDKVKEVKRWSDEPYGEYKLYTFTITMENGDSGRCASKDFEHKYFVVGAECEYFTEEVEKKDKSGSYINLKRPKKEWTGGGGGGFKHKGAKEYKSECVGMAAKFAYDSVVQFKPEGKRELKDIKQHFDAFVKMMWDKLDELHS